VLSDHSSGASLARTGSSWQPTVYHHPTPAYFGCGRPRNNQLASSTSLIQTLVDEDKRGWVMSMCTTAFSGSAPRGSMLAGGPASHIGAPNTILISGVSVIRGAVFFARRLTAMKKFIKPILYAAGNYSATRTRTKLSL